MAPKQFACCYFPADNGAVVLKKKKLTLKSEFKPFGEVDVKFTVENEKDTKSKREKETVFYYGQILKISTGNTSSITELTPSLSLSDLFRELPLKCLKSRLLF